MNEVSNLMPNVRIHFPGRKSDDDEYYGPLDPFHDPSHKCPKCGRSHFCYNTAGVMFCQRDGNPMGRLVRSPFGKPRRQWT